MRFVQALAGKRITATPAATTPGVLDDPANLTEIFGRFLRLYVAEGDASPATTRTYHAQAQFVTWWLQSGLSRATATGDEMITSPKHLVEVGYKRTTMALKLAVVRRRFKAIRWRGLSSNNPAAGVEAPRDRTSHRASAMSASMP